MLYPYYSCLLLYNVIFGRLACIHVCSTYAHTLCSVWRIQSLLGPFWEWRPHSCCSQLHASSWLMSHGWELQCKGEIYLHNNITAVIKSGNVRINYLCKEQQQKKFKAKWMDWQNFQYCHPLTDKPSKQHTDTAVHILRCISLFYPAIRHNNVLSGHSDHS